MNIKQNKNTKIYLWWVGQVEGMVKSEVYKPQKSGVHLCESCHYPVVDICWVLKETQQLNDSKLHECRSKYLIRIN